MFETGVRQFRMAMAMVGGRRINPRVIERLTGDVLATLHEFGAPGDDVRELLDGPLADPESREHFQLQALRRTVRRLGARSAFYAKLLADIDLRRLTLSQFQALPLTTKADLVNRGPDLICHGATPYLSTRTTGTTGKPSRDLDVGVRGAAVAALGALSGLLRGELRPSDCLQVNISSRATAAVQHAVGDIPPGRGPRPRPRAGPGPAEPGQPAGPGADDTELLPQLPGPVGDRGPAARPGPADFSLRIINVGGEVLSPALRAAAEETFGAPITDTFGMTEILPVSGRFCDAGHLHPDLNMGFVEVVSPEGTALAAPESLAGWWSPRTSRTGTAWRCSATTPPTWCAACPTSRCAASWPPSPRCPPSRARPARPSPPGRER